MLYLQHEPEKFQEGTQRRLLAADGYLSLGMLQDAIGELDQISPRDRSQAMVLVARTRVLLHQRKWADAERVAAQGNSRHPDHEEFRVQRAFALHQLKKGDDAMNLLLDAPEWLRHSGILHYNLACYEAQLGDLQTAKQCIRVACKMNKAMKKTAVIDPDLRVLWN